MKNIAIYPGTFDPITYGHIDVIKKGLKFLDKIIIAISNGDQKNYLFDIHERSQIVNKALFFDMKFNIIFSDALHTPEGILSEYENFISEKIDEEFILYFDDLDIVYEHKENYGENNNG